MSTNANADQWFESYPYTMQLVQQGVVPLQVVRHNGSDYAYGPGVFRFISSSDDYHFLRSARFINVPHNTAPQIYLNLLEYIRNEAARWAPPGVAMDAIVNPSLDHTRVAAESVEEARAGCEHCAAEDAARKAGQ
jgi:hypothetical protein